MKKLQITYFAILREERGTSIEDLATTATTPRELYSELRLRHQFSLPLERLRVALNGEFASWDAPLSDGTKVALIPPVAGG